MNVSLHLVRQIGLNLAVCWLVLTPLVANADIPGRPRPVPPPKNEKVDGAPLEVVLEDGDKPMRLEIPQSLLPKEEPRGSAFGGLDDLRTIIAGLALALAVAIGGLWAARRFSRAGRPFSKAATSGLAILLVVAGLTAATAWADLIPPGGGPRRPPREVPAGLTVKVVVVDRGDKVIIRASRADLAKLMAGLKPGKVGAAPTAEPPARAPRE